MPPGVHRNKLPALHLSAAPSLETPPPLTPATIHEQFRALLAGRDCLVDTPFGKPLEARWSAQTASTEFTVPSFEETLVLSSSFYLLSEKQRARERHIAWQTLEYNHPNGNPTVPAHGIICGHETFRLYAFRSLSQLRIPLLQSTVLLETTPDYTPAPRDTSLFLRRGETFRNIFLTDDDSSLLYEQTSQLLSRLAAQHAILQGSPDEKPATPARHPPALLPTPSVLLREAA